MKKLILATMLATSFSASAITVIAPVTAATTAAIAASNAAIATQNAARAAQKAKSISYDCDYTFDGHEESVVITYKENPARLVIDGKEYRQPRDTVLKHKMRWQMFEGTAIIRDTFSGKLQSNSTQIKNLKCEIFGA